MSEPESDAPGSAGWRTDPEWPDVDVVMPIRDEADHLEAAVASVRRQAYPGRLHIVLGVAPSADDTEALAERLATEADDLTVVPNPAGSTPAGLNAAIRAGTAPVVVRVDGHSELSDGYVERAVQTLRSTGAVNVGGRQVPRPTSPFEQAVAHATTTWLGTGGATYRVGGRAGPVDTVYLGVFDRAAIERVGLFDDTLVRNQDYELNIRLRADGGAVWFDPELWVGYRPRSSWRSLWRQYVEYGGWKATVLRRHPESARLRQVVPPIAMTSIAVATVVGARRPLALALPGVYLATVLGWATARTRSVRAALVLPVIHVGWAAGFLVAVARRPDR